MSDANKENMGPASGMTGRMLSRTRRQALSQGGKASLGAARKAAPSPVRPARIEPAAPPKPQSSLVSETAAVAEDCCCTHAAEQAAEQKALDVVCDLVEKDPAALGSGAATVRQMCQDRRRVLSSQGKTALPQNGKRSGPRRNGKKSGSGNSVMSGLSGREAARARREELCIQGRGDSPACRPSGRVRSTSIKVEEGSTLSGNLISGTQVERSNKVTGILAGSCRAITGTEYIGAEQYSEFCASTPAPGSAKVGSGTTSRGQRVSGTEVGRSVSVTGDEHGDCKSVTGTEYLSSEQFESFCGKKPASSPAKVGVSATQSGKIVSGTEVGRSKKVTGDEPGACLKLTGSQYYQPDPSGSVCKGSGVPHKVSVMNTVHDRPVTGTNVAASDAVTGSEFGACSSVTGIEYAGLQQYQACNRDPVMTPEKVALSRTWRDQTVSGTNVEHNQKVTGDEYGGCQPISGTEYIGPGQYSKYCAEDQQAASSARVSTRHGAAGASMTGVGQRTENHVTGTARGPIQNLSGSAYSDDARYSMSSASAQRQHPLAQGPADRSRVAVASAAAPVQGSFSVNTPARTAQESQRNRVTGTAYGAQGRITGPVNLAIGLVSGTPEFRHREDSYVAAPVARAPEQAITAQANRVTGEGRESGFAITGAAWRRSGNTTGTEGSSTHRNPTLRGEQPARGIQRSMAMQAPAKNEREHMQVPPSKVTGSSGNTAAGSTITYSGGARG